MTLVEQVYAQAVMLAGVDEESEALLQLLCRSAVAGLKQQLRKGVQVDDCKADFVAAASLYATPFVKPMPFSARNLPTVAWLRRPGSTLSPFPISRALA